MQHKLFNWTVNCQGYVRPGLAYFDRQESTQKWWHFTTKDLETLAKQNRKIIRTSLEIIPLHLVFTYFPAPGILGQIST